MQIISIGCGGGEVPGAHSNLNEFKIKLKQKQKIRLVSQGQEFEPWNDARCPGSITTEKYWQEENLFYKLKTGDEIKEVWGKLKLYYPV